MDLIGVQDFFKEPLNNIIKAYLENPSYECEFRLKGDLVPFNIIDLCTDDPIEYDVEYYEDNIRKQIINPNVYKFQQKIQHHQLLMDYEPIGIKVSLSTEIDLPNINHMNQSTSSRHIKRYTIKKFTPTTSVMVSHINNSKWEIELEFLKPPTNINNMLEPLSKLLSIYFNNDRPNIMCKQHILNVCENFYKEWSNFAPAGFLKKIERKPVNIIRSDLQNINQSEWGYVSNKLNGAKYMLILFKNCIYAISEKDGIFIGKTNFLDGDDNFLDGEWDPIDHTINIWDIKTKDKDLLYEHRIALCEGLIKKIKHPKVLMKPIYQSYKLKELKKWMIKTYGKKQWQFRNDGYIFTPNTTYLIDNAISNDRYYKTLKYKWPHDISIDLLLKVSLVNAEKQIATYATAEGNNLRPMDNLVHLNPIDEKNYWYEWLQNNMIAEIIWNNKTKAYEILKLRPDKLYPNFYRVVDDTVKDMHNPITEDELESIFNINYVRGGGGNDKIIGLPEVPEEILELAKKEIDNDRLEFSVVYEVILEYIKGDTSIIIDYIDDNLDIITKPLTIYTKNGLVTSNNISNELYQKVSKIVFMKTVMPHAEFHVMVLNRLVLKVLSYPEQNNIKTYPIFEYNINPKKYKMLHPTMQLIDIYHTLYKPFSKEWEDAQLQENKLINTIKSSIPGIDGGKANQSRSVTYKDRLVISDLREKLYNIFVLGEAAQIGILIGHWAIAEANTKSSDEYPIHEKIQYISQYSINDIVDRVQGIISHFGKYKVSYRTEECNLANDLQLTRTTYHIDVAGAKIALMDTYNSMSYELIPFIITEKRKVKIAHPYVIARFALIDYWMLKIIKFAKKIPADVADKKLKEYINIILHDVPHLLENTIIDQDLNYEGVYKDFAIEKRKIMQQQDKFRPYKPMEYFSQHGFLREI
jgi:hypothetical protein